MYRPTPHASSVKTSLVLLNYSRVCADVLVAVQNKLTVPDAPIFLRSPTLNPPVTAVDVNTFKLRVTV